ncbi:hypothetical protein AAFH68_24240 [Flavobacterium sp. CGRL1]
MTLPTIPDNYYKLFLYSGLVIIAYCFVNSFESQKSYNIKVDSSNSYIDTLKIKRIYQEKEKKILIEISDDLSRRYNITNPIKATDSTASFNYIIKGTKEEIIVSDSIKKLWNKYINGNFEIDLLDTKIDMIKKNLSNDKDFFENQQYFYFGLAIFGALLGFVGIHGMEKLQKFQETLIQLDISSKDIKYKFCQSCGKNFNSLRLNGKNKDGEVNYAFCSDCFNKGKFTESIKNKEEFDSIVDEELKKCTNKKEKEALEKRFKLLERWNSDDYK